MGVEHYRYIILDKYNSSIQVLKGCLSSANPDYNYCLQDAIENDEYGVYSIRELLLSIENEEHHVLENIVSSSILYSFKYNNSVAYDAPQDLREEKQSDPDLTLYKEYFPIELSVTGKNNITNESKTINVSINLPLNLLKKTQPGEGTIGSGNLIPPPPPADTFPSHGSTCPPETGYLTCKGQNSSNFNLSNLGEKEIVYLHGKLYNPYRENNDLNLNGSKVYINGDLDLTLNNGNWLKNGTIYVYNDSDFQFLSTKNIILSINGDATIQWNTFAEQSTIEIGGSLIFNDSNKTISLTDTEMNIKGAVKSENISHNNYFTLNGESTLYLNGSSNTINTLTVNDDSKVCIRSDAKINNVSISPNAKVYYLSLPQNQVKDEYTKLSPEHFAELCSVGSNYNPAPELGVDDITSDIEYGSTP